MAHTSLGWIGTGIMGRSMCGHLVAKGHALTVYSRTRERAAALVEQGARWADSPADVAAASDIVFTMVGFPSDVRDVYFGDNGVLRSLRSGAVAVDMTTTEPSLAIEIATASGAKGAAAVDAPVSGGDVGARNATLSIMVGGDPERGGARHAALRGDGQEHRPPGRSRRRPAHEDVQSDRHRRHDGRRVREPDLRHARRPQSRDDAAVDQERRGGLLDAGESGASRPRSATSIPASSSSTSSRTWGSRWPRRGG